VRFPVTLLLTRCGLHTELGRHGLNRGVHGHSRLRILALREASGASAALAGPEATSGGTTSVSIRRVDRVSFWPVFKGRIGRRARKALPVRQGSAWARRVRHLAQK